MFPGVGVAEGVGNTTDPGVIAGALESKGGETLESLDAKGANFGFVFSVAMS